MNKTEPLTPAERMREMRKRRAETGQKELRIYAHPDDHQRLKAIAKALQDLRES